MSGLDDPPNGTSQGCACERYWCNACIAQWQLLARPDQTCMINRVRPEPPLFLSVEEGRARYPVVAQSVDTHDEWRRLNDPA